MGAYKLKLGTTGKATLESVTVYCNTLVQYGHGVWQTTTQRCSIRRFDGSNTHYSTYHFETFRNIPKAYSSRHYYDIANGHTSLCHTCEKFPFRWCIWHAVPGIRDIVHQWEHPAVPVEARIQAGHKNKGHVCAGLFAVLGKEILGKHQQKTTTKK